MGGPLQADGKPAVGNWVTPCPLKFQRALVDSSANLKRRAPLSQLVGLHALDVGCSRRPHRTMHHDPRPLCGRSRRPYLHAVDFVDAHLHFARGEPRQRQPHARPRVAGRDEQQPVAPGRRLVVCQQPRVDQAERRWRVAGDGRRSWFRPRQEARDVLWHAVVRNLRRHVVGAGPRRRKAAHALPVSAQRGAALRDDFLHPQQPERGDVARILRVARVEDRAVDVDGQGLRGRQRGGVCGNRVFTSVYSMQVNTMQDRMDANNIPEAQQEFNRQLRTGLDKLDEKVKNLRSQMIPLQIAVRDIESRQVPELQKILPSVKTMQQQHGDIVTRLAALEQSLKKNQNHNTHHNHYNHRSRSDTDPIQQHVVEPVNKHVIKPLHNWLRFKERAGQNPYMINASVHEVKAPVNPLAASNA